jgi:hypothetical protein
MYIQHEAIESQKAMANSPNHTVVYIPVGPIGGPIAETSPPVPGAESAGTRKAGPPQRVSSAVITARAVVPRHLADTSGVPIYSVPIPGNAPIGGRFASGLSRYLGCLE